MTVSLMPGRTQKERTFSIPITLHPAQQIVDASPARFNLLRAGRKFGKSTLAIYRCIRKAGAPGSVIWFVGPTYKQSKLIAWKEFKQLIPREALAKKPNETDLYFTLKNGSEIYVMGADNPDSLRGPAPNHVGLEEAAMQQSEVWHEVIRPNLTAKRGSADFITTPKGFNWFKDLEDRARALIAAGNTEWAVFHYSIYGNPHISREEIESAKTDCDSEAVWRQEYLADYESSVGRVFSQFSDERHCRPVPVPHGNAFRAIDYGMRDDTAGLWGHILESHPQSGLPMLKIYREHLQSDTPASVQGALIRNKTTPGETIVRNAISHDAAKQDAEMQGLTVKWHFENAGIRPLYVSSRDKRASRHMIQQLIAQDRLVIDPAACPKLRKQLLAYEWKDTTLERTADGHDDAVDALHYLVELLQYDLFLDQKPEQQKSMDEIWGEINAEKKEQRARPKLSLPREELSEFKFDDTHAGYL